MIWNPATTTTHLSWWPLLLLLLLSFCALTRARIGPDGSCRIQLFAPFTRSDGKRYIGIRDDPRISVGFSNMAAALLAVDHFNARNKSLIPELADVSDDCNVQLEIDKVFDTQSDSKQGSQLFLQDLVSTNTSLETLCALVGPYHDTVAQDTSVLASAAQVPLVVARSWSLELVKDNKSPFTTSVYPDTFGSADLMISYLLFQNRTDFIALLYPLSDLGLQRRAALGVLMDNNGMAWTSSEYLLAEDEADEEFKSATTSETRSIREAVRRIKASGYRTIVLAVDDSRKSFQDIADAVQEFGMNNGGYFFCIYDEIQFDVLDDENENVTKMLFGSAYPTPISRDFLGEDGLSEEPDPDPISKTWSEQGQDFAVALNLLNPIQKGQPGYIEADAHFFNGTIVPDYGAAFVYDSVVAVGLGACRAQQTTGGSVSGLEHHIGIRNSSFVGCTGFVQFGSPTLQRGGTRPPLDMVWSVVNLIHTEPHYQVAHFRFPTDKTWQINTPFIYADGTTVPPKLLRDEPEQNYLSTGIRLAGLILTGFTMLVCVIIGLGIFFHRKYRVWTASQPVFLYFILFGSIVQSSTTITLAFDENNGLTNSQLSGLCMSFPWLFIMGNIVVDSALFTKLWRVHKVLQFSRRKVKIEQVIGPMVVFSIATILILSLWTALDPLVWQRDEINSISGESVGRCLSSGNLAAYLVPLIAVILLMSALLAFIAYKTKDVDDAYSESKWIFIHLLVQAEVVLVAAPVALRLSGEDPNTTFIAFASIILVFPWATIILIFGPKVYAHYLAITGRDSQQSSKRGERSGTRVTGISAPGITDTPVDSPTFSIASPAPAVPPNESRTEPQCGDHGGDNNIEAQDSFDAKADGSTASGSVKT